MNLMFPKPKDVKKQPVAVKVFRDGREKCNLLCKAGRDEYEHRKDLMHTRQSGICCLYGHAPNCPGRLLRSDAAFEHQDGRTSGHRDDRIEKMVNGKLVPINGVAHPACNGWKGSRRIYYNDVP